MTPLRFLFLEPFYGGSHKDVADGLKTHSRHAIDLITLPDRFWKWRMRGAALYLAERVAHPERYDGLIVSSLMNLADLKALWQGRCPPALVYFHENQVCYPLGPGEQPHYQYGFTNIATALSAERILFNSETHRRNFLEALPAFIRMMPDCRPTWIPEAIAAKSDVARPGCHFPAKGNLSRRDPHQPPLIVWNHRWEHDKHPEAFFQALAAMHAKGLRFNVVLLGERYGRAPQVFSQARTLLGEDLLYDSFPASRRQYYQWLARGAIVISTAIQENFGIAVIEAMRHGCLPLLPDRLSYPEILPREFHEDFLYTDQHDLEERLAALLRSFKTYEAKAGMLPAAMGSHAWTEVIDRWDKRLEALVAEP